MPLDLTRPIFLLGLLALPVLIWYFVYGLTDFTRSQRITSLVVRSAILLLLVLSLAGLTLLKPTREKFVVVAIDDSLSVSEEGKQQIEQFVNQARESLGDNKLAFVHFAAKPGLVRDDSASVDTLDGKGTNLAQTMEVAAAAAIPPEYVPHIVMLTDGNQTDGDALGTASQAGIPISTVPLTMRTEPEVQVSEVDVPAQVRDGEPFYVEVVVNSNHDDEGMIEVYRGPYKVVSEKRKINKGENRFRFQQSVTGERLAEYTARIKDFDDRLQDNNAASGLVYTAGKPRVLMIDSDASPGKELAYALDEEGIQLDIRPPRGLPENLADLQNYEAIMLSNIPATAFTQQQMEVMRTYVQDLGGGLIMLGGDQSFGLGGYYKTTIEEILPVRSDFEKEKEKPSLAMVLVIDKSGSMGGDKIEMAKDAARSAVDLLGPKDKIGVIAFEGSTYWIADTQPATNRASIIDRISAIEAGGGTTMAPAMEEASLSLQQTVAKLKHVIILTDGISSPGDFIGITEEMSRSRITVSTVALGEGCDTQLLEEIARVGKGRTYVTTDPAVVPQIFAKETVTASKSAINELPFMPQVIRPTQALQGIDFDTAPFLLGYVTTRPKATSELILTTEKGDPLLAWWRYGLGMTVAFTSDAKARWAAEWLSWPGYGKFWAQVIRHTMRKGDSKGVFVNVARNGNKATVTLDAVNIMSIGSQNRAGRYRNDADSELTVIDPQLGNRKIAMKQTAPGRYVGSFDIPTSGTYHMEITQKVEGVIASRQSRGLTIGYEDEFRLNPTNDDLLQKISTVSGGIYNPTPQQIFTPTERTANRVVPLWPYLLWVTTFLFLIDVALRRLDWTLLRR